MKALLTKSLLTVLVLIISTLANATCGDEQGTAKQSDTITPDLNYLSSNNFDFEIARPGNNVTVSFSFQPEGGATTLGLQVDLSLYLNFSIKSINLYTNSCVLVGTGSVFENLDTTATYTVEYDLLLNTHDKNLDTVTVYPYFHSDNVQGLPVSLLDFSASSYSGKIIFTWVTASELNNAWFVIEKSSDGKNWNDLARVPGNGTTSVESKYLLTYHSDDLNVTYYRLKQIDLDGSETLFNSIAVYPNNGNGLRVVNTWRSGKPTDKEICPGVYYGKLTNGERVKYKFN